MCHTEIITTSLLSFFLCRKDDWGLQPEQERRAFRDLKRTRITLHRFHLISPRFLDYFFGLVSNGGSWFLCSGAPPLGAGHARPPRRLTRLLLRPRGCATPAAFPTREILPFTLTHGGAFRCVVLLSHSGVQVLCFYLILVAFPWMILKRTIAENSVYVYIRPVFDWLCLVVFLIATKNLYCSIKKHFNPDISSKTLHIRNDLLIFIAIFCSFQVVQITNVHHLKTIESFV